MGTSPPTAKLTGSLDDVQILRAPAAQAVRLAVIAKRMRGSESAMGNAAALHGITLCTGDDGCGPQSELKRERGGCKEGVCVRPANHPECLQ